jgi:Flp pilus assembly protein TadD
MRIAPIFPLIAAALIIGSGLARADELQAARAALGAGDTAAAAASVERFLAAHPNDARGRFLRGVILNEQGRTNEAFDVFFALTQDHPQLAEPYNNLAVLYAARGDYERARNTLEMAIRANPEYATAYENLGDLHARLAVRAYEQAARIEAQNRGARAKLALARDLMNYAPQRAIDAAAIKHD